MTKRWLVRTVLVVASVALALGMSEIALRIVGVSNPVFYMPDEVTGFSLRPGAEGRWTKEGQSYIRINSAGLRDVEHSFEKPDGTYRIAILGDSYAEALQVSVNNAFWKVLERELARCQYLGKRKVEVINFGVSGYGTAQELLTLQSRVKPYQPDLVLLALVTGNDIRNNMYALELDPLRPYFIRHGTDLLLDDSFRRGWTFYLARRVSPLMESLRLIQLADTARIGIKHALVRYAHRKHFSEIEGEEPGLDSAIYVAPRDPAWIEAWTATEMLLERFRDESAVIGAKPLAVTLSNGIQVHPSKAVRERFMDRLKINNLFYPESRLSAFSKRAGFPLLTMAPRMQQIAQEGQIFFHGFDNTQLGVGHWNETGHRYAGEFLAKETCKEKRYFITP